MIHPVFERVLCVVRGGGDLGSGAIYRLHKAGLPVVVLELPQPVFVRRAVCFGEAIYSDCVTIEGVTARHARDRDAIAHCHARGEVPVVVDPDGELLGTTSAAVLVDARMEKRSLGVHKEAAPLVIGLGPGFAAGVDCHAVVETNRGHDLGRVIWEGSAEPDTGEPGVMHGKTHSRVLRAPAAGHVHAHRQIGDSVLAGEVILMVAGQPITAAFQGVVRGIIHASVEVTTGMKIGDLDPRCEVKACFTISDKSLAVGGGVVEAVLSAPQLRAWIGK
jgi:xanthine dehydrogenase accessory factor